MSRDKFQSISQDEYADLFELSKQKPGDGQSKQERAGVRDNPDIQTQLSQHGGSFDTSRKWEERHLLAVNPSVEFSYAELQHIGKLFGQSYQSINTFFDQKRFGYLSPGISFSEFKIQAEHFGIERFPFFTDTKASETAKSELMRIISRRA